MLQISDAAVEAIREMAAGAGLRFTGHDVDGEVELEIEAAEEPTEGDEVIERDGARVFLDPRAADALSQHVLDVEPHGDHVHFAFVPQDETQSDSEPG